MRCTRRPITRPWTLTALAALAFFASAVTAGGPPIAAWDQAWTPANSFWAIGDLVAVGPAGDSYVATRPQVGFGNGTGLVKYMADGTLAWAAIRDEVPDASEGFTDLEVTDEGISAVGLSLGPRGEPKTLLVNYASDGSLIWEVKTSGAVGVGIFTPQLAISASGDRIVASDDGNGAGSLERYDATGQLLSQVPLSFTGVGGVSTLDVDAAGNAILVSVQDSRVFLVEKYDAAGIRLWSHEEEGDGFALSGAFMTVAAGGDVVVTGALELFDDGGAQVVARVWRLSPDGQLIWRRDTEADFEIGRGLAMGPDGAVYLLTTGSAPTVTRISTSGVAEWSRSFAGADFDTSLRHVEVSAHGDVIVGGVDFELPGTFFGARLLCYTSAGDLQWTDRVTDDSAVGGDLATGTDGSVVYVTTTHDAQANDQAFTVHLTFSACLGDLDNDGAVGFTDLLELLGAWGDSTTIGADLDQSGEVGVGDLLMLLAAWGPCA